MPTDITSSPVRRSGHPRRLLLLAGGLMMGLLVTLAVGIGVSGASDPPCKDEATGAVLSTSHGHGRTQAAASTRRSARDSDGPTSTGLDLELRIGHLRIEFPWLKSLPLSPGRHIVISLFDIAES
jgi:hypothetical protein